MARKKRMESIGFYHIVNRGVERRMIFMNVEDHLVFLEILQESAEVYGFTVYAYTLMNNHYHLLIKTSKLNLSLLMRQINSRYSMYFNRKYKRVGPLWQGRFKSWYVYDEYYLKSLIKYIEHNPIKAKLSKKIGEFRWSMSSKGDELSCLDYSLMDTMDLSSELSKREMQNIDTLYTSELEIVHQMIVPKKKKPLSLYFEHYSRETAIANAIEEGYKQIEIAEFLGLSSVAISKIYKNYREKITLFNKMRDKGIFWSYSKSITYTEVGENIFIEHLLKYGDFDDIQMVLKLFGKRKVKNIWQKTVRDDQRFIKLNLMLARVFFGMNVESDYFRGRENERFKKLKLLAS